MEAATTSARTAPAPKKKRTTDRAKAERKLAWTLCAPAVIAMLLVTGYPIGYALYLSLQKFDLRFPDDKEFVVCPTTRTCSPRAPGGVTCGRRS